MLFSFGPFSLEWFLFFLIQLIELLVSIKSLHLRFINCDLFICIYVFPILAYQLHLVGCKLTDTVLVLPQNKMYMDKLSVLVSKVPSTYFKSQKHDARETRE